jgi:two-component system, OmpR family, sensor histidine kinase TctE
MPEGAAPAPRSHGRLGIRAQLLALLLPGIAALLAFDSWTDYHDSAAALTRAYDQALVEPVVALDESVFVDDRGALALRQPFDVLSMFEATEARQKFLHVGALPLDAQGRPAGPERSMMGPSDLPGPTRDVPQAHVEDRAGGRIALYEAQYHGVPVRIARSSRVVRDGAGRTHEVRVQAAEAAGWREQARAAILRRELIEDGRMLLVMVALVWIGLAWTLRPLERLRDMLRRRSPQQLEPLDATQVPGEVAPLVEAVNHHIADHRRLLQEQAQFLADASHQLRTPLAIMMTQAGYALRERDPVKTRETLQAIMDQLSRSRRLSEQLLALAHASRAGGDEPACVVDLNTVARDVVLQYLTLAHEMNQDLGFADARGDDAPDAEEPHADAAVPVLADAAELHEALANLLHNAIRHTPVGGRITVAVRSEDGVGTVEVRDSGPGLPPDRYEAVFRRFHRDSEIAGAASGGARRGGAGLGLAIARAYAHRNGGEITFAPGELRADGGRGLAARLQVPLARPSPA